MPDDPQAHMMDYFGNYRSPEWDVMDKFEEENDTINEELPDLRDQIAKLEADLAMSKRKTRIVQIYKTADPDGAVSYNVVLITALQNSVSTKMIVQKLSGFAKFEVDHKLTCDQFITMSMDHVSKVEDELEQ